MLSGKNIAYITLLAIAGVLIYYFFFKKKVGESKSVLPEEPKSGKHVDGAVGQVVSIRVTEAQTENTPVPVSEQAYVGPQDCAENCNLPYHNRLLFCYNRMNGSNDCFDKADKLKQECLGKCSDSLPRYKNLEEVATPLQEDNYNKLFNNLFNQGYV